MLQLNQKYFYSQVRELFKNPNTGEPEHLNQEQVNGLNILLQRLSSSAVFNTKAKISYALATIKRETADTFHPVVEGYWMSSNRERKLYNYYRDHNPGALSTIFPNGANGKS